jgi:CBS domain-containing protein
MANRNERVTDLPLRSCRTFDGEGESTRSDTVLCPSRRVSVDVDTCMDCGYCARPPAEGERVLACLHPAGRPRPAVLRPVRLPSSSETTPLREVMTTDVICVREDLAVESLATLMLERNISAVPVVDAAGRPVGVASKTDLVRWYHDDAGLGEVASPSLEPGMSERQIKTTTVGDLMMPLAFTLCEDAPVVYAATLMAVEGVHHLPIVSGTGTVVGIVSALDLVRWIATRDGFAVTQEGA